MKLFFSLFLKIVGITLVIAGLVYLCYLSESLAWLIHESIWIMLLGSAVIALLIALYNTFALSGSAQSFVPLFLGSMLIRFFLSIFLIGFLLFKYQDERLILVLNFFVIYLSYLVFEIFSIIGNLRPISNARDL